MSSQDRQLEATRAAKRKARRLFGARAHVTGIGIVRRGGAYCVKVNLEAEPEPGVDLPEEIDGIPVIVQVTGRIRKQPRPGR